MKTLYFDCVSGISGDMALAALIGAGADVEHIRTALQKLDIGAFDLAVEDASNKGFAGKRVWVTCPIHEGHGRRLSQILGIIASGSLSCSVAENATRIFTRLAEAEAKIHGCTPEKIHFHEVGAVDSIVDIVGACLAIEDLGIDQVFCSPLPLGTGFVECAHGTIPLPAPATLELLRGIPTFPAGHDGETVTPTGAAIVSSLANEFGPCPAMVIESIGYGIGTADFPKPNLLRAWIGCQGELGSVDTDSVAVIETTIDDMSPQFYEPVIADLFAAGALDAYLTPIQMKKGRPGVLVTAVCRPNQTQEMAAILIGGTTTLGVRTRIEQRACLPRETREIATSLGIVRVKTAQTKPQSWSIEYEDVRKAAAEANIPFREAHVRISSEVASRLMEGGGAG